eukprot:TRINITY_DN4149_c0_g1_i1.p1 TRINITY_DN4149_c0_g1~~TRINITY_DN4149_c0_g1_i1.p1  ORF type:complete len:319 (+),score=76.23 TRINITY_DN4149_c0_g1_i1:141-1097(+)
MKCSFFFLLAFLLPLVLSQQVQKLSFSNANVATIDPAAGEAVFTFQWETTGGIEIWASAVVNQTANNGTNPTLGNRPIQLFLGKGQQPTITKFLVTSNQTTDLQEVLYATTKQMTQGQYFLLVDSNVDGVITVTLNAEQIGEVGVAFGDILDDEEVDGFDQVYYHFSWTGDNVANSKSLSIEIKQDDATGPQDLAAYLQKDRYPTPTSFFRAGYQNGSITSFQLSAANMTVGDWYLSVVNPGPESIEYELIISDRLSAHSTEEPWSWKSFFVGIAVILGIIVGVIAIFVGITIVKNNRRRVDVVGNENPHYNKLLNEH